MKKRNSFKFFPLYLLVAGLFFIHGCGDDTVSPEIGVEPEIPLLQGVQINSSYFVENNPSDQEFQEEPEAFFTYLAAKENVVEISNNFDSALELPKFFLLVTSQREPEFQDGVWVWSFPYTVDGSLIGEEDDFTVDVHVTAEVNESADQVSWEFLFSGSGTPFGDLENFRIFDASTSLDNSSGQLRFYSPEYPDTPLIDLFWDITMPNEKEITVTYIDTEEENEDNGPLIFNLDYIENEPEYSLALTLGTNLIGEVNWNSDSGTGSVSNNDGTFCWGEDLRSTDC